MTILFKYKKIAVLFGIFSLIYIFQTVILPADKAILIRYHLSRAQAAMLLATVALPYIFIWFMALIGYLRLHDYATAIRKSKDGNAFATIARGVFGITIWLPLSAIVSSATSRFYAQHPDATATMVRLNNYLTLLILFIAFVIIFQGTRRLLIMVKQPSFTMLQVLGIVLFTIMMVLYIVATLHDPARRVPTAKVPVASYYLPDWVTYLTIIVPRIVMWTLGLIAVQYIYMYRRAVKGVIYRDALQYVASGFALVILISVILRYIESLPAEFNSLALGPVLLLIYVLLAIMGSGYALIAKGARQLQRIEEL